MAGFVLKKSYDMIGKLMEMFGFKRINLARNDPSYVDNVDSEGGIFLG